MTTASTTAAPATRKRPVKRMTPVAAPQQQELDTASVAAPEQQTPEPQPQRADDRVYLVGFLKAVKEVVSDNPDAKYQVTAILTNSVKEKINGRENRVELPIDGIIASNNGKLLASDLMDIARTTEWARVRIGGFWTTRGGVQIVNGYLKAAGRQLRVQSIEVLSSMPLESEPEPFVPEEPTWDPSDDEPAF